MKVPVVQLRGKVPDAAMKTRKGTPIQPGDIALLLTNDCDVYRPDGKPLCKLRRAVVPVQVHEDARPHLLHLARKYKSDNRGAYGGFTVQSYRTRTGKTQTRTVDAAGKIASVESAVAGYFEPQGGRFPFCRMTQFPTDEPEKWQRVLPLIEAVAGLFEQHMPAHYRKQLEYAEQCADDFRIAGTPFSTITVNHNVAGAVHKDAGDLKDGFGMITCARQGSYTGGWLCFPQYKVAVDLQDRDLIFFNPHDWHGVTTLEHADPNAPGERITVVYYFREGLKVCGSAAEELAKVKNRGKL